jgi:hypothetical protein
MPFQPRRHHHLSTSTTPLQQANLAFIAVPLCTSVWASTSRLIVFLRAVTNGRSVHLHAHLNRCYVAPARALMSFG